MHKKRFMIVFACTHLIFIFLLIYKHTLYVRASFDAQKNERLIAQLEREKQEIMNTLYTLQNHETIQQFAQQELAMQPISLAQIHKIEHHEDSN